MLALLILVQSVDPLAVMVDDVRGAQDAIHYHLEVWLPAEGSQIRGATSISYKVVDGAGPLVLDFDEALTVDSVVTYRVESSGPVRQGVTSASVSDGRLAVDHWGDRNDTLAVTIHYHGEPPDGLFIQPNVHGVRTAFADNWPNRARHWFPGEDHPSDKATASFSIAVPSGWSAVANGSLRGVDSLPGGRTRWHWRTERPIPVYTMVIGAGPLTVTDLPPSAGVQQQLWTFPEDSAFAVDVPFRRVQQMVEVFTELVGPFPYTKLAHVESSTRFGGMENSSAIFYTERGYASRGMGEGVVAHETAHQWFGDAVTERDWHHLWLSEGFASYFSPVFFEFVGENDTFRRQMENAKSVYLSSEDVHRPVIDTSETDLFALLNRNNYQKGAWILHMLRGEMGDLAFFDGVRDYYGSYRDSTALSSDLLAVMQRHAGRPLRRFFEQWLLQPGYPQLDVSWMYSEGSDDVVVRFVQTQPEEWGVYDLEVPVQLLTAGNAPVAMTALFEGSRTASVRFGGVSTKPDSVAVDPTGDLLLTVSRSAERR